MSRLIREASTSAFSAFLNAVGWATVWCIGFFISNAFIEKFDYEETTLVVTALALTAAVLAGHMPKLISYLIGRDTDFRRLDIHESPKIMRFLFSCLLLTCAAYFLGTQLAEAREPIEISLSVFIFESLNFYKVILCLFMTQFIYSWPDFNLVRSPSDWLRQN